MRFLELSTTKPGPLTHIPSLELVRGVCCLEVMASHLARGPILARHPALGLFVNWGVEAVLVFFVLSGYVIERSQTMRRRDAGGFMRSRLRRLLPIYLVAIVFSVVVEAWVWPPVSWGVVVGHLAFLQYYGARIFYPFNVNGPLWSLSFEFYFYLIYALTLRAGHRAWVELWWVAGLGAMIATHAGWHAPGLAGHFEDILAMSPVWLLGTTLARRPLYFNASLVQNAVLFSFIPLVSRAALEPYHYAPTQAFLFALLIAPLLYSLAHGKGAGRAAPLFSWAVVAAVYLLLVAVFLATSKPLDLVGRLVPMVLPFPVFLIARWYERSNPALLEHRGRLAEAGLVAGGMSYAVYVIHVPFMYLMRGVTDKGWAQVGLTVSLTLAVGWWLERRFHPWVLARLRRGS